MYRQVGLCLGLSLGLGACATSPQSSFEGQRGVFNNPYVSAEIDNGPVGPDCDEGVIRDDVCWIDGVAYPLGKYFARDRNGNIVRLNRAQRRAFREQREAIRSVSDTLESLENGTPIPPDSPALPQNQSRPAPMKKGG